MNESRSTASATAGARRLPFDSARLDDLLDEAGIDAVVISSKHNIQYLFGGYRFFFFDHFDAIGVSRYLPLLIYVKGRPDQSTYIGHGSNPTRGTLASSGPLSSKPRERRSIPRSSPSITCKSLLRR